MERGVEVNLDGRSLRLGRLQMPTDPIPLAVSHKSGQEHQIFTFSIESVTDSPKGTQEDSGFYNMNINQRKVDTEAMMLIKEIQIVKGEFCTRIDVFYLQISGL